MTGCGCVLLVTILVGGIVFMIFGSTDPGEPIEQIAALGVIFLFVGMPLIRMTQVPLRRALVRERRA